MEFDVPFKHQISQSKFFKMCQQTTEIDQLQNCKGETSSIIESINEYKFCDGKSGQQQEVKTYLTKETLLHKVHPVGHECVFVFYAKRAPTINLNSYLAERNEDVDKIVYSFAASKLFGLNITFENFLLSDICLMKQPFSSARPGSDTVCSVHIGSEFVLFHQGEHNTTNKLYFCLKRPWFSVFTKNILEIDYHLCQLCISGISRMVFFYSVIEDWRYCHYFAL